MKILPKKQHLFLDVLSIRNAEKDLSLCLDKQRHKIIKKEISDFIKNL
jgi:hypothetical protein